MDQVPLFKTLPAAWLETGGLRRRYAAGTVIFRQGEATSGLWVILRGRVAVERLGPDGVLYTTGVWHDGEIVGIAGLWDGSAYPASARALDDPTELWWAPRERVTQWVQTVPAFADAVCRFLAERLRIVQETVADTRGRPLPIQLAVVLVTLAQRFGAEIALTHEDLAHMLGAKRESVTRALGEFARRGWVEMRYGRIHIARPEQLQVFAAEH